MDSGCRLLGCRGWSRGTRIVSFDSRASSHPQCRMNFARIYRPLSGICAMSFRCFCHFGLTVSLMVSHACAVLGEESDWLEFRGPGGRSAVEAKTPVDFGGESRKNIAWYKETAGRGVGSPLVVSGQVIVTASGGENERDIYVESYDAESGDLNWRRTLHALGRPFTHPTSANASPSPVSDGERIYALYSSCDLVCLGIDGQLQWYRALAVDHPKTGNDVSMSSSPAVIDGVVIVQLENQGDSWIGGIDAKTGVDLWQQERPRRANWSSPLAIRLPGGQGAFVVQSSDSIQVLNAKDGAIVYEFDSPGNSVSSPVIDNGRLLVPTSGLTVFDMEGATLQVVYENSRLQTRNASHVVLGDRVYACRGSVLVAGRLSDGEMLWQQRLSNIRSVWATPVATSSGIYVFDQDGQVAVIRDNQNDEDPQSELVAELSIPGPVLATPAVVGDAFYVRSENAVYKIAAP